MILIFVIIMQVRRSQEDCTDLFDEENASEMDAMDIAAHRSVPMRKAPPPKTSLEEAGSSPGAAFIRGHASRVQSSRRE